MRAHGTKNRQSVGITFGGCERLWEVTLNYGFMKDRPYVAFGAGWKSIMDFHDVVFGESLQFELTGDSLFNVTRL